MQDINKAAAAAIVAMGDSTHKTASHGAAMAKAINAAYLAANGDDKAFVQAFGNGKTGKLHIAGEIAEAVRDAVKAWKDKSRVESVLNVLKSRLSEARRLRKNGGVPADGETLQQACKRYAKPAAEKPAAEKPAAPKEGAVIIPEGASMADIAEAVSLWVAKHGNAGAAGLAKSLADFLPVSIKRQRAA